MEFESHRRRFTTNWIQVEGGEVTIEYLSGEGELLAPGPVPIEVSFSGSFSLRHAATRDEVVEAVVKAMSEGLVPGGAVEVDIEIPGVVRFPGS